MALLKARRVVLVTAAAVMAALAIPIQAQGRSAPKVPEPVRHQKQLSQTASAQRLAAGDTVDADEPGEGEEDERFESAIATEEFQEARTAPGIVAPGAYGAAYAALKGLSSVGGRWSETTNRPYNADDTRYRDFYSNSSGGAGLVTGRVTGLAADSRGYVYAGGANGGVWRSSSRGGRWTPISNRLPSLSTGDLELDGRGRLWYATGEANTGATSYVGTGVYVLSQPRSGTFAMGDRVGGKELESTIINALRFGGGKVYAATSSGVWSHSTTNLSGHWTHVFAPNPAYLAGGPLGDDPDAAYKNIANDVAIDPAHPDRVVLAIGWRGGDTYNGLYRKVAGVWTKFSPLGDLPGDDIGNMTFAYSRTGSKLYAINESIANYSSNPDTALGGVYVSASGSPYGPFTLVADSEKLRASGSALQDPGYRPGIQAWYNQFLTVDPADSQHLWVGLEEVFESKDGGATWTTPGPYWNFSFPCWTVDLSKQSGNCPQTTHPDQHAVAVGSNGSSPYVVVGNDGGVYRRPVRGALNAEGHATDWKSLNDGTIDTLQYYSVDVGRDPTYRGVIVSGGLQDNGGSILRSADRQMGSNFGGDGGDSLVDPDNGCNIVQEYVYLTMSVTQTCAATTDPQALVDPTHATTYAIAPDDPGPRFIAPFAADTANIRSWIAGGQYVWGQKNGFAIRSGSQWRKLFDLGDGHSATAVSVTGGLAYVSWCGPCNNQGFTRGIAVGGANGTGWHQLTLPVSGTVPNRYVGGIGIDPRNNRHVVIAMSGFSRTWTEGPGAGVGHVFESRDAGATWKDISSNLPDVPSSSIKVLSNGALVLGTDLAVLYRAPRSRTWKILGKGLPTTVTMDVEVGPQGRLYTATHGRGIWDLSLRGL